MNGHFDVPCPVSESNDEEDADGANEGDSGETAEALRFFRWVQRLHEEYRAFKNGKQTKLNDARVTQLLNIGFEFKKPPRGKATMTP